MRQFKHLGGETAKFGPSKDDAMSSSNRFQQFSAGWMTTKKVGRDDTQIKKDRARALAARKKVKKPQKPKFKKAKARDYDSDDSMDEFIVGDDIEEEILSSDSDELEIIDTPKSAKTTPTLGLSSDESLSEQESFLPSYTKRTSKATGALRHPSQRPFQPKLKKKDASKRKGGRTHNAPISVLASLPNSDDSRDRKSFKHRLSKERKRHIDLTDTDEPPTFRSKRVLLEDSSVDSPLPSKRIDKQTTDPETSKYFANQATAFSDDVTFTPQKDMQKSQRHTQHLKSLDDERMDEDEAMAVAWALQESQKEHQLQNSPEPNTEPSNPNTSLTRAGKVSGSKLIVLDEEESEEDQDAEVDEYQNTEDHREAKSVLESANDLSMKVLKTMMKWSQLEGGDATKGMIVDGALSMFEIVGESKSSGHTWISRKVMETVCPKVKLADYQLIGVNWLALLHGMEVEVGDGKMTNVNGVLADSMGLGKTVQTIAFLAWLRKRNEPLKQESSVADPIEIVDTDEETEDVQPTERPHLIVVPASVLSNWKREFEKFCPDFKVVK